MKEMKTENNVFRSYPPLTQRNEIDGRKWTFTDESFREKLLKIHRKMGKNSANHGCQDMFLRHLNVLAKNQVLLEYIMGHAHRTCDWFRVPKELRNFV